MKISRLFLATLLILIAISFAFLIITLLQDQRELSQRQLIGRIGGAQANSLQRQLDRSLSAPLSLAPILRQSGKIDKFEAVAADIIRIYPSISSLQLAPDGVVRQVYPPTRKQERIGHNLLEDPKHRAEATAAIQYKQLRLTSPSKGVQGKVGTTGLLPVFIPEGKGERFWGFIIVEIRLPDLLQASGLNQFVKSGFDYALSGTDPASGRRVVWATSSERPIQYPVSFDITVPNGRWALALAARERWRYTPSLLGISLVVMLGVLVAFLTYELLRRREVLQKEVELRTQELVKTNQSLETEISERKQLAGRWTVLQDMNRQVSSTLDPEDVLNSFTFAAVKLLEADRSRLFMVSPDGKTLQPKASFGSVPDPPEGPPHLPVGGSPSGTIARDGEPVIINNVQQVPSWGEPDWWAQKEGIHAYIGVPLTIHRQVVGVLNCVSRTPNKFQESDFELMDSLTAHAAAALENARSYEELRTRTIQLEEAEQELAQAREQEIQIGSRIEQTLLLGQPPQNFQGLRVAAMTKPSQRIDGDFYDFIPHNHQCLDIIIGDMMGKGIPAALLGAATKSQFLRAIGQLISSSSNQMPVPEPQQIVARVHTEVTQRLIRLNSFATICYVRFDNKNRQIKFVDCGHTKTVHFRHQTGDCQILQGENMPLGFSEDEVYQQVRVPFETGDVFFFYSDGVTDARNGSGEFFGTDRLEELIQEHHQRDPQMIIDEVVKSVTAFSHSDTFTDDLTCIAVEISDGDGSESISKADLEISSHLADLSRVREFVRQVCTDATLPPLDVEWIEQLELAVNEAVGNVMKHSYHGEPNRRIQIEAEAFSDRIAVHISHTGDTFDPDSGLLPTLDGSKESGFGLFIIQQSVDDVTYSRDLHGRNQISLFKHRTSKKGTVYGGIEG